MRSTHWVKKKKKKEGKTDRIRGVDTFTYFILSQFAVNCVIILVIIDVSYVLKAINTTGPSKTRPPPKKPHPLNTPLLERKCLRCVK